MFLKPVLSLVAAALLVSVAADPASAQRGRGGNRGDQHRDYDRDRDHNRNYDRRDHNRNDWNFSFSYGAPYYRPYSYYPAPAYYNQWGLAPYECRVNIEFDYWYGRPADIEIRRCADAYGNIYIVHDARRLYRYRY